MSRTPSKPGDSLRINKFLAACLPISRRKAEEWVRAGKVSVNGIPCVDLARVVNAREDQVELDGKTIKFPDDKLYIIMNKPRGYLVTADDPYQRKTVFDLLPDLGIRLFPVGRLDYDTEGLLLFTNDGELSNRLLHPRYKLPKVYRVKVKGKVGDEQIGRLRNGISLDGRLTQPAKVFVKTRDTKGAMLRMTINEGMNRQIRRMMESVGLEVVELKRTQFAGIELGKLPIGMWRLLKPDEVTELFHRVGYRI